jgi:hypothetical protein
MLYFCHNFSIKCPAAGYEKQKLWDIFCRVRAAMSQE